MCLQLRHSRSFPKRLTVKRPRELDFTTVWFWKSLEVCSKLEGGDLGVLPECWSLVIYFIEIQIRKVGFTLFLEQVAFQSGLEPAGLDEVSWKEADRGACTKNRMTSQNNQWLVAGANGIVMVTYSLVR